MTERSVDGDTRGASYEIGRGEDVLVETPTSAEEEGPKRSSRRRGDPSPEVPAVPNDEGFGTTETSATQKPGTPDDKRQVMGGITVRELEMLPNMEEIARLIEIPVGGVTNIEPQVIGALAGVAARSVPGVANLGNTSLQRSIRERFGSAESRARGVEVEVGRREAIVDISFKAIYGYSIPDMVVKVRHSVAATLLQLAGLLAKEINIRVTGIEFPERMPGRVD